MINLDLRTKIRKSFSNKITHQRRETIMMSLKFQETLASKTLKKHTED